MSTALSNEISKIAYYKLKVANNPRLQKALNDVFANICMDIIAKDALGQEILADSVINELHKAYAKIDTFIVSK